MITIRGAMLTRSRRFAPGRPGHARCSAGYPRPPTPPTALGGALRARVDAHSRSAILRVELREPPGRCGQHLRRHLDDLLVRELRGDGVGEHRLEHELTVARDRGL